MFDEPDSYVDGAKDLLDRGEQVPYALDNPCHTFVGGLLCGAIEGYIIVKPFGTSFHYERRCANNHFIDNVSHAQIELYFGIPRAARPAARVRDALSPSRRVAFNVTLRDRQTCVYCGRRAGDVDVDGSPISVAADHIIAKHALDADLIRGDRELLIFARDLQLVTACRSDNSTKREMLIDLDVAREIFVRHVLRNQTKGSNLGYVSMFDRLYRMAELNLKLRAKKPQ